MDASIAVPGGALIRCNDCLLALTIPMAVTARRSGFDYSATFAVRGLELNAKRAFLRVPDLQFVGRWVTPNILAAVVMPFQFAGLPLDRNGLIRFHPAAVVRFLVRAMLISRCDHDRPTGLLQQRIDDALDRHVAIVSATVEAHAEVDDAWHVHFFGLLEAI